MMVAALGAGTIAYLQQPAVYSTAIGERRTVALEDGSRITLDSDTELHVRYSRDARRLTLDRGRARFDVAHDASRPFTVDAGQEAVTALGTSFDVERIRAKVLVMLFEGRLAVSGTAAGQPTISLAAGQRLSVTGDGTPAIAQANLKAAAAWQNGMLVFNDDTLDEAAARMNRYAARPVEIDPSLAALRISGVFKAGDVDAFVEAVTSFFPVQAIPRAGSGILILPRG